jgi:hypothetical protein
MVNDAFTHAAAAQWRNVHRGIISATACTTRRDGIRVRASQAAR